jgi:hypothetical protein
MVVYTFGTPHADKIALLSTSSGTIPRLEAQAAQASSALATNAATHGVSVLLALPVHDLHAAHTYRAINLDAPLTGSTQYRPFSQGTQAQQAVTTMHGNVHACCGQHDTIQHDTIQHDTIQAHLLDRCNMQGQHEASACMEEVSITDSAMWVLALWMITQVAAISVNAEWKEGMPCAMHCSCQHPHKQHTHTLCGNTRNQQSLLTTRGCTRDLK